MRTTTLGKIGITLLLTIAVLSATLILTSALVHGLTPLETALCLQEEVTIAINTAQSIMYAKCEALRN